MVFAIMIILFGVANAVFGYATFQIEALDFVRAIAAGQFSGVEGPDYPETILVQSRLILSSFQFGAGLVISAMGMLAFSKTKRSKEA